MKKVIRKILRDYSTEINDLLFEEIVANQKEIDELGYVPTPIKGVNFYDRVSKNKIPLR
jgi:hypothetical protein